MRLEFGDRQRPGELGLPVVGAGWLPGMKVYIPQVLG